MPAPIRAAYRLAEIPLPWLGRLLEGDWDGENNWASTARLAETHEAFVGALGSVSFILAHPEWWAAQRRALHGQKLPSGAYVFFPRAIDLDEPSDIARHCCDVILRVVPTTPLEGLAPMIQHVRSFA